MSKDVMEMRRLAGLPLMENYVYAQEEDNEMSSDEHEMGDHKDMKSMGEPSADDKAEYDQEGRMAKQQLRTGEEAAEELQSILDDDENLPEWIQLKITKAVDYLRTADEYMKNNDVKYTDENVEEAKAKPDYLDFDKDGDKEEPMKKALADKKKMKESADLTWLQAVAGIKSK
jgi:hypothetical protein